jgi:hypothetical protein
MDRNGEFDRFEISFHPIIDFLDQEFKVTATVSINFDDEYNDGMIAEGMVEILELHIEKTNITCSELIHAFKEQILCAIDDKLHEMHTEATLSMAGV